MAVTMVWIFMNCSLNWSEDAICSARKKYQESNRIMHHGGLDLHDKGDERIQLVLLGWDEGMRGKQLREFVGVTPTELDYIIKRFWTSADEPEENPEPSARALGRQPKSCCYFETALAASTIKSATASGFER